MARKNQEKQRPQAADGAEGQLPPGVKLLRKLETPDHLIKSLAFDPKGQTLVSGGDEGTMKLWDVQSGKLLRTLKGHDESIFSLAFRPQGDTLASGGIDRIVRLWQIPGGKLLRILTGHQDFVRTLAFDPKGATLASGSLDGIVHLWEAPSGKFLRTLGHGESVFSLAFDPQGNRLASGHRDGAVRLWGARNGQLLREFINHTNDVNTVAFQSQGEVLASGSDDVTVKLWDTRSGKLLRTLEGHTSHIDFVLFSSDGRLLVSKSGDHTIRLWSCKTWETVAVIQVPTIETTWLTGLALHSTLPLLAASCSPPDTPKKERGRQVYLWELDYDVLLDNRTEESVATAVHHTTGKIVLVGDHSVGKSALGHRLIEGVFKEQASTHGQQFWVFPELGKRREDGTECEAILWDFAGQPDYRLVHALFIDNADLALVLFDGSDIHDPLHGVGFWLKQLQTAQSSCPIILVAAQTDRGTSSLTLEELSAFCRTHGIIGPIATSAATGAGIDELVERMKSLIAWEDKAATVTTTTFKRIKDYMLSLKQTEIQRNIIVTPNELRERLEATDPEWHFSDDEMITAMGHLENYGYVKRLRTSTGELRILLQPERLNNLASSFVLEARRNPRGLGALEEKRLLTGDYKFPELKDLDHAERDVLLDSAALLFLEHNVFSGDRSFAHGAIPRLS